MSDIKHSNRRGFKPKRTDSLYARRVMIACRKRLNLSVRQAAEAACVHPGYYSKIENGQCTPSIYVFISIAKVLGVDWKDIAEVQHIETQRKNAKQL